MVPQIDFLPATYHVQRRRRHQTLWRRMMVFFFLSLSMLGTWQQRSLQRKLEARRDELQSKAQGLQESLPLSSQLEQQLTACESKAQLLTRLELRIPTTRILAAVTGALPEYVSLTECQADQQTIEVQKTTTTVQPTVTSSALQSKPLPFEIDLNELQAASSRTAMTVTISGLAPDDFALSRYLVNLRETDLFERVKLAYTGQQRVRDESMRAFQIRLQLRNPLTWIEPTPPSDRRLAKTSNGSATDLQNSSSSQNSSLERLSP